LLGDNSTGKTSLLDALAIAVGVWLVNPPDTTLANSKRNILTSHCCKTHRFKTLSNSLPLKRPTEKRRSLTPTFSPAILSLAN
ncbi:MAG: hypothetical protein WBA10_14175, partial [Elainellaceae cyanobacterium]